MEPRRVINPMPESLDEANTTQNQVPPKAPIGAGLVPPKQPTKSQQQQVNNIVTSKLTEEALDKEILDEKIRQDIASKQKTLNGKEQQTPKDILKALIAKGEYSETREILGNKWTMKALSQNDLIMAFKDIDDETINIVGRAASLTLSQVVFSIQECNGIPVSEWFSDMIQRSNFDSSEEYKLAVRRVLRRYLSAMPSSIINEFNTAYEEIEAKRNEGLLELKKS